MEGPSVSPGGRQFTLHPALGRPAGNSTQHHHHHHPPHLPPPHHPQGPVYTELPAAEGGTRFPPPAAQQPTPPSSSAAGLGYPYPFASPYYDCKLPYPRGVGALKAYQQPGERYSDAGMPGHPVRRGDEGAASPRPKDFAFYPGFGGSYQTVPGYYDLSVVPGIGETRHDPIIPVDGYQHWPLASNWDGQFCGAKQQAQPCYICKSPFPDIVPLQSEGGGYRRGRKKRVPYTKLQLKELEREYAATKFITKEKRRKISTGVNLSERQVTIWFQNRRVKDKKLEGKSGATHPSHDRAPVGIL